MLKPNKTFHRCFGVFVLVLYFKCATIEINTVVSVLFQFYFNCAGTIKRTLTERCFAWRKLSHVNTNQRRGDSRHLQEN